MYYLDILNPSFDYSYQGVNKPRKKISIFKSNFWFICCYIRRTEKAKINAKKCQTPNSLSYCFFIF